VAVFQGGDGAPGAQLQQASSNSAGSKLLRALPFSLRSTAALSAVQWDTGLTVIANPFQRFLGIYLRDVL
jgi:hypothetical protein